MGLKIKVERKSARLQRAKRVGNHFTKLRLREDQQDCNERKGLAITSQQIHQELHKLSQTRLLISKTIL